MRNYTGIAPDTLPKPDAPDFHNRLRSMLSFIDYWASDASFGFNRIILGENPNGSGEPLGGDVDGGVFFKLLGRPSNQIGYGGTGPTGSLTLSSTIDGTKGKIYLGDALGSAFNEANGRLGIGTASPSATLHVRGSSVNDLTLRPTGSSTDPTTPWTGQDGGTVLGNYLDEVTPDDNDYIKVSLDPSNGSIGQISARIALPTPPSTPSASNTHTFRVHYRRTGTGGVGGATGPGLDVAVYKGGTVVTGSWISVAEPAPSGSWTSASVTLTGAQITGLGDYTGLEVWVNWTGSRTGCSADSEMQVSWFELDCGTATSVTDLAAIDDGGVGVLPSWTWNSGLISVLPTSSTDTQDSVNRLHLKTLDSIDVFRVRGDGTVLINIPQNTYSGSNPVGLTIQMLQSVTPNNPLFQIINSTGTVASFSYYGALLVDVSANVVGLAVDGGTSADIQRWTKASVTKSFIDTNGAFNGPIIAGITTIIDTNLTITGSSDATKTLKFELDASTANADLVLDYRSAVDRSLIWNLSGGTGGNLQFNWAGTATRTVTIPTAANFTIAGLQLANAFTRQQTITAGGSDVNGLVLNFDSGLSQTGLRITDTSGGQDVMTVDNLTGTNVLALTLWTGGSIGSGFSGSINNDTLTASRTWTFPNLAGKILIGGASTAITGSSASVGTTTLVASNALQLWLITCYLSCVAADATGAGNVQVTIGWTDVVGAQTYIIASRTLQTVGSTQGTVAIWVQSSSNITYSTTYTPTAGGVTETYNAYLRATNLG
jgi:hypothetical protein